MDKKKKPIDVSKYQKGGKVEPLYVTDPNDPRLRAYQDSTDLYDAYQFQKSLGYAKNFANNPANSNKRQAAVQAIERATGKTPTEEQIDNYTKVRYGRAYGEAISPASDPTLIRDRDKQFANFVNNLDNPNVYIANRDSPDLYHKTIMPTGYYSEDLIGRVNHKYEKPVQPVELKNNITGDHAFTEGDDAYIGNRWVGKFEQTSKNTTGEPAFKKMISKMPPKRKEINIDRLPSLSINQLSAERPLPTIDVDHPDYTKERATREWKGVPNLKVVYAKNKETGKMDPVGIQNTTGKTIDWDKYKDKQLPKGFQYPEKMQYGGMTKKSINASKYQSGGLTPIYVDSPDDPRFIQYQRKLAQEQIENQLGEASYYEKNLRKKSELDASIGALNFYIKDLANYNNRENPSIARVNTKTPYTPNSKKEWEYLNSDRPVILRTNNKKTKDNSKKIKEDILDKTIATIKRDKVTPSDYLPTESLPPRSISPVAPSLPNRPGGVIPPPRSIPNPPMAEIPRFTPPKFKPASNAYNEPVLIPVHKSGPNFSYLSHYETKDGERVSKEEALKFINKYQQGGIIEPSQAPKIIATPIAPGLPMSQEQIDSLPDTPEGQRVVEQMLLTMGFKPNRDIIARLKSDMKIDISPNKPSDNSLSKGVRDTVGRYWSDYISRNNQIKKMQQGGSVNLPSATVNGTGYQGSEQAYQDSLWSYNIHSKWNKDWHDQYPGATLEIRRPPVEEAGPENGYIGRTPTVVDPVATEIWVSPDGKSTALQTIYKKPVGNNRPSTRRPPREKEVPPASIGSVAPTTSVGTGPSRQVQEPNVQEHNVLGDQVFIPVTKSGSYHNGEAVGSDRIIRYESVDGTKSYTKKEYEKLKKGQVKTHQYGGKVKKYPGGGPIGNYPDAINNWKEYNNYVPTVDPPSGDVDQYVNDVNNLPFLMASPFMGALIQGNLNEKNAKQSDVFNPIQGFQGYNYQMGGNVNINTSGYTPGYPSFDNPENTIPLGPSKTITMKNTPFPVLAIPDVGEPVILKPGEVRKFKDATKVREIPMKNNKFQLGGTTPMGAPQGQPSQNSFDNIPNKFNNQTEDPFVLASYLPYILGDSRNTLNAGKRPLAPIQTEDGEMITSPLGDMVDVAATKAHKNMESDEITDFSAEGNYILSDDKNMIIKKGKDGGVVNGINLKDVLIGMDAMYYKEGELIKTPKEYTLEDIAPKKSKYTFAELGKNVQRYFPLSTEENDIFAKRAQVENKLSRVPYINSIIELSEIKKQSMNKKGSPANFKQGGYASMAKIYNPALKSLGNTLADGSTNGFYFEPDPQLNPKRDNNFKTPTYQGGGYTYDDREKGQNKREQWNYWINQTQDHFNDFEQDSQRNNQAMFGVNALGILGQSAYQGDNDYLYGNTYNSKMDNLSNKVDRSFGAEQSYNEGLVGRENSAYRFGLNSGATPNDFAPSRANALREQGSMNNNMNKERRSFTDRYGTMDAQSSDMFAGRRNQQKAYLNDFSNNQVQNLAGAGTGYLQNKIGIQAANLQAQSSLQLMKQAGNGWTDFTNGLGDVITAVSGILGSIYSGSQGAQFDKGKQTPQQQQTMDGLNPNNWGGSNMFQNNTQLYGSNPWSGYNPNSQPYQPSWNENRGWGSGGPG